MENQLDYDLNQSVMIALRRGTPIDTVIALVERQAELLRIASEYVHATQDARHAP